MTMRFRALMFLSAVLVLFTFILIPSPSSLFAQDEISYDPYSPVLKYPEAVQPDVAESRDRSIFLLRTLELPARPIGYGLGETAEWVERNHVDDKVVWFFDELHAHGIYPKLFAPTEGGFGTVGLGGRIEFEKLFQVDQPFFSANTFGGWTPNKNFAGTTVEFGGDYKIEPPTASFVHEGKVRYRRSSSESFYGIGQDTSLGEWSGYQPEELKLEASLSNPVSDTSDLLGAFVYQRMNIGNGNRERIGKIKEHFPVAGIPGINGGDLIGGKTALSHDNRDHGTDPKKGGYETLEFSYFHDTDGNGFHYLKVGGSAAHFFTILSDRRVLALRLVAEKNQELGGDEIPFFNMSRLGGSDQKDGSELLRSYRFNRFFDEGLLSANAEYRYNIYEYDKYSGDAVVLFDVGEVFGELGDFALEELKFSYGGSLNLKFRRRTILSLTIARGNEGWKMGVHSKAAF